MKRILKVLTASILFLGLTLTFAVSAFAWEKPIGSLEGSTVSELTESTDNPDMNKIISWNLTYSNIVTEKSLLAPDYKSDENREFTKVELAEIGNQFKYGISLIGARRLARPVGSLSDQYFATGNAGDAVASGKGQYGAFEVIMDGNTYNVKGESVPDADEKPEGYAYKLLFTFNFGKIANIESFAFVNSYEGGVPQAADIYVSDDGTNWTLVGYYDRNQLRQSSNNTKDYQYQDANLLGKDKQGNAYSEKSKGVMLRFDLPKNTQGQFIRIACTAPNSGIDVTKANPFRELLVWGTLTDRVGYTYQEGDGDYVDPDAGNETEEQVTTGNTEIVTKKPVETKAPATTENVTEKIETTGEVSATEEAGCKSSVGFAIVPVLAVSGVLVAIKRRREE